MDDDARSASAGELPRERPEQHAAGAAAPSARADVEIDSDARGSRSVFQSRPSILPYAYPTICSPRDERETATSTTALRLAISFASHAA
jgi:hypothetical protein